MDPVIKAHFNLNANGTPKGSKGNYSITLSLEGAPDDAYAVTYILHPTYYSQRREVFRTESKTFNEEILSYGEFDVAAKIMTKRFTIELKRSLYEALSESHGKPRTPEIDRALQAIGNN